MSTPDAEMDWKRLVDFAIGLEPSLPVEDLAIEEVRFGIPVRVEPPPDAKPRLRTSTFVPTARAAIRIRTEDHGEAVSFNCDVYAPQSVFPFVPKAHTRIRFVAPHLQIILGPAMVAAYNFKIPPRDVPFDLFELSRALELTALFDRTKPANVILDLSVNGHPMSATIPTNAIPQFDPDFKALGELVISASRAASKAGIPTARTSIGELLAQAGQVRTMLALQMGDPKRIRWEFELVDNGPAEQRLTCVMASSVRFGDQVAVCIGRVTGIPTKATAREPQDDMFVLIPDELEVLFDAVIPSGLWKSFDGASKIAAIEEDLEARGLHVLRMDEGSGSL